MTNKAIKIHEKGTKVIVYNEEFQGTQTDENAQHMSIQNLGILAVIGGLTNGSIFMILQQTAKDTG